jgi:hypothetical protein
MALTIYEGIKDDQQVDENIDEEILRLLGLEDVSDLDYDEYKTLLKERMAAGRMPGNDIPSEDTERITEEYKRVKKETGRFRVRNRNKIKFDSVIRSTEKTKPLSNPTKTLMGADVKPEEETKVTSEPQDVMEFLTAVVAPSLSKIETSLANILANLSSQQQAEDKAASKARTASQKAKSRDKEEKQESGKGLLGKIGDVGKKVLSPLSGLFSSIFKFLFNIAAGILALGVLEFLKDPGKIFRDIANSIIDFFNGFMKSVYDFIFFPFNLFIDVLNGAINEFEFAINNTIGNIPGIPDLKLPDIGNIEPPQIERIPPPEEKTGEPKEPAKKAPVPAMAGGGEVTNITNQKSEVTNKYYQLMEGGGKVRTDSGEKVTGAGPDTQLVALQPGEVVMSKPAVDTYGADTLLGMNASAGGTNSPKMAKVQSASGGGLIPAMSGGGYVGTSNVVDTGYQDYKGRPVMLAPPAASAFKRMVSDGMPYNPADVANVYRDKAEYNRLRNQGYIPASNSFHNHGEAADIHGEMNTWIRKNGAKYGWKANDYSGSHGGHFEYKGGGGSSNQTQVDPQETVTGGQKTTPSRKSKDYWALAAIMSVEAGNPQGRADVATSIMNRAASGGVYTGAPSIHALVNATNQYEPVRKGDPKLWSAISDKESAIRALNSVPYVQGQGASFISEATAVLNDQGLMKNAAEFVGPRSDFSTPSAMSVHKYRDKHRSKEATRLGHVFGFFVGPGAVELGTKRFGEGAGATSMESMNMSSGDSSGQQPEQLPRTTTSPAKPFTVPRIAEFKGTPGASNHSTGPSTSDLSIPSMTAGSSSLPIVSPTVKPSSRSTIQPPRSRTGTGGIIPVAIPGQQQPTSSTGANQAEAPMFSSTDQNNPELLVIKSIYNIVG